MKIKVFAAGKPALGYAKLGVEEYLKRLRRLGEVELVIVKAGEPEAVSKELLRRSEGCLRVALDERGKQGTTFDWVRAVEKWEMNGGVKAVAFLIGASAGHTEALRRECQEVWGMSALTMQHELALLVFLEQIYRVYAMKAGVPYHR